MLVLLLTTILAQEAPSYEEFEPSLCHPEDASCIGPADLDPMDRAIIFSIIEEANRRKAYIERLAKMPVCPYEPNTYWNLECA